MIRRNFFKTLLFGSTAISGKPEIVKKSLYNAKTLNRLRNKFIFRPSVPIEPVFGRKINFILTTVAARSAETIDARMYDVLKNA